MRAAAKGLLALAVLAAGCTMIPEYTRPEPPVPAEWPDGPAYSRATDAEAAVPPDLIGWREFFAGNPTLTDLVSRALDDNRELRVAALDVQRARAQYRIERSGLLPEIDANASYTREDAPAGGVGSRSGAATGVGGSGPVDYYEVGVGLASYELDLFGRIRSLESQALQTYLASAEARRSAQISLIAEVANAYLSYLADSAQLRLAKETLGNRREFLALTQRRFELGVGSELDVNQARTAVESARSEEARFRRLVAQDRNALRVLVGGELPASLTRDRPLDGVGLEIAMPADLDSELLLRRPDVRRAEHQLRGANASIGAARAAFFPRITLTGSYGSLGGDLDGLFESGSEVWSFSPQITLPIFDAGRRDAALDAAQLRKRAEIARYERTIQQAFREVADALAAKKTLEQQRVAQRALVEASRQTYRLARKRYRVGTDSYLPVLDAQRELFAARQALIDLRRALLSNEMSLYRALGGGWRAHTVTEDAAPSSEARRHTDASAHEADGSSSQIEQE